MRLKRNFVNIVKKFDPINLGWQHKRTVNRIYSDKKFRLILDRERARVDRNNHPLSLVLFKKERFNPNAVKFQQVVDVIVNRMRTTDEVGWFDHQHLGVILPDTTADGAMKFASDVCTKVAAIATAPTCEIYTYPCQWFSNDDDFQQHFKRVENSSSTNSLTLPDNSSYAEWLSGQENLSREASNSRHKKSDIEKVEGLDLFFTGEIPIWKRVIDLLGSFMGIVLFTPVMIVIALAIKLTSPGPIIFKQRRIGYRGRPFTIYKFRSMVREVTDDLHATYIGQYANGTAEKNSDGLYKLKDDPRVTSIGQILRKWSLDELPQLFNVLKGDMSLVGPRPEPCYVAAHYSLWHYSRNMETKPGLTGEWQVGGRSRVTFDDMIRMDIKYNRSFSFMYDLKLIFRTFWAVLSHDGAY